MLQALDIFYTLVHLSITGFNLLGWIWPRTRKVHLVTVSLTLVSWVVLGIWYGFGYCPVTDWQWDVKEKLGEKNLPNSFIKYFADKISGRDFDAEVVDAVTLWTFVVVILVTLYINFIHPRLKKKS